jgi:hypothetical protein
MITNDTTTLDITNESQYEQEIFMTLPDNGDHEYIRIGFGKDQDGLYMVDLDDTGDKLFEKIRVDNSLSIDDVLEVGADRGVFEKVRVDIEGSEANDYDFAYNIQTEDPTAWDKFVAWLR